MEADILSLSVAQLVAAYRDKSLSPVDTARAVLSQVREYNPVFNAFAFLAEEQDFLAQAQISETFWRQGAPRGELEGVPVTIKDGANVAGWPTREGSLAMSATPAAMDSPLTARMREAGAVFLGKTTLPEFGHKGVTESPLTGVTRNPWNPDKTCGGSSGGAGVAAATRMGFLHHGSDGGGSIRIPASFCGVFGHKPSAGLVPTWPPTLFSSLSVSGPITRSVEDAARMLDVISRPDARDWYSVPYQKRDFTAALQTPAQNLRIAYARTLNDVPVEKDVAACVEKTVRQMDGVIGTVEEITLELPALVDVFFKHWASVARWIVKNVIPEDKSDQTDPYLRDWAKRGEAISLDDYQSAELGRAMIGQRLKLLFDKYDVLVLPTMPVAAFDIGKNMPNKNNNEIWEDWTPFTFPANLGKFPAASIPCGLTSSGLPVGIQMMSGYLKDELVLRTSHALESLVCFRDWMSGSALEKQKRRVSQ